MAKSKGGYYAVRFGRVPGIYLSWEDCSAQVEKYPQARFRKFEVEADALAFVRGEDVQASTTATPDASSSKSNATATVAANETGWQVVYCDGACKGNGKAGSVAGVGVWWGPGDPRNIAERCPGDQTNNRAELIAIARVLETTRDVEDPLLIKTDSQYSLNTFKTFLDGFLRRGWVKSNGDPVKNAPLIRYLAALMDERAFAGRKLRLKYVKGHSGDVGNDGADRQANRGVVEPWSEDRDWDAQERKIRARLDKVSVSKIKIEDLQVEMNGELTASSPSYTPRQAELAKSQPRVTLETCGPQSKAAPGFKVPAVPPPKVYRVPSGQKIDLSLYEDCLMDSTPQISPSPSPLPSKPKKVAVQAGEVDMSAYADDWDDLEVDENGEFV